MIKRLLRWLGIRPTFGTHTPKIERKVTVPGRTRKDDFDRLIRAARQQ